jgi:hypothetical protein
MGVQWIEAELHLFPRRAAPRRGLTQVVRQARRRFSRAGTVLAVFALWGAFHAMRLAGLPLL